MIRNLSAKTRVCFHLYHAEINQSIKYEIAEKKPYFKQNTFTSVCILLNRPVAQESS